LLDAAAVAEARRLVELAMETAPHAIFDEDGETTLALEPGEGDDGVRAAVTAMRAPDGVLWASLARTDGLGLAEVPALELAALARVLAAAERKLAELGLARLSGDLRN
jgi:hypothetical protein